MGCDTAAEAAPWCIKVDGSSPEVKLQQVSELAGARRKESPSALRFFDSDHVAACLLVCFFHT